MQQKAPWEEDWSQPQTGATGRYPTITIPRDPLALRRDERAAAAADRAARNDTERLRLERERIEGEGNNSLDVATRTFYAQQVLAGAPMPSLGMGKQAAAARQQIMAEVARLAGAAGLTGTDQAAQIAHYKAGNAQIANLEKMAGTIGVNEQTALANGQQFIDRSAELPGQTSWAPVNAVSDWIQRKFGGTTISAADAAYNTFVNEYAKVVAGSPSGAGTLSDSARHEAMNTISGNGSLAQKQAAFAQMKADMSNRMIAIHGGINEAYKALTRQPGYQVPDSTQALHSTSGGNNVWQGVGAPAIVSGMPGGPGQPGSGSGPDRSTNVTNIVPNSPSPGGGALATGDWKTETDPARKGLNSRIESMLRSGANDADIRSAIGNYADVGSVNAALEFRRAHPTYKGGYSVDLESQRVPTTGWNRFAASPTGTGIYAGVDGALGGLTDEIASLAGGGNLADLNARKQAAFAANPKATFTGQAVGTIGSMAGIGALGRTARIASRYANPALAGDIAFGTFSGAGQSNDNRLLGSTLGAVGGLAGNVVGNTVASGVGRLARTPTGMMFGNRARGLFGARMLSDAQPLNSADNAALTAINRAGVDNVTGQLTEAQRLGIPMSLADTNPNLRELAGAAVRRSPTASSFAESTLLPRARGQYDRFTSSVNTNLGPTANIPQLSADMMTQARSLASNLYDRAYSNPVPSTPEMDTILSTPFGRDALGRAGTIAANERRSPEELGFALNDDGSVRLNPRPNDAIARHLSARADLDDAQAVYKAARSHPGADLDKARDNMLAARGRLRQAEQALNAAPDPNAPASVPAYTTQTLDYVKRGMDDVLEDKRNPITGRLVLDEAGRAQNQVRGQLLSEVDRLNPDFAAARSAYAGPMESRDALARGADAYRLHPDELGMQVGTQSPEQLGQMQLGYRGAMVDHAGQIRDSGNPWETTLGSPVARQRLDTMYPGVPGVADMMRQRELEAQLAQTTNGVLGNSKTAQRGIADETFAAANPLIEGGLHAGAALATGGASIPGTAARVAGAGLKNWMARGQNRMSEARAEALAPVLLNTDPSASLDQVMRYIDQQRQWQALVEATTPRRALGMFGRGVGSQAAVAPVSR